MVVSQKLEEGVEGLVHVSEMDWTNKNIHPSKVVQLGDEVEVMVLEIDEERRQFLLVLNNVKKTHGMLLVVNIKKVTKFQVRSSLLLILESLLVWMVVSMAWCIYLIFLGMRLVKKPCANSRKVMS